MYCNTPCYYSYTTSPQPVKRNAKYTSTDVTCSVNNGEQGVALLIRPLCLKQRRCGSAARCRLAHFAYHRRDFQLFVG